ncbi:hypothetical protein [uncultured Selenomonas sp.]|uniref:hypothetical protein n=1 Tax=uncultured Selenomonas sp. TaxID=159275 RepID=UPI0025F4DBE9|nr:hypothetical protein [uncultured Selenomonas sp.]
MRIENLESGRTYAVAGCFAFLFLFLFLFFTQIHPLVVFDSDDWMYISFARKPVPSIHEWNPTRIFAECFQPLTGYFAAYVVTPIVGDYLHALTYTAGLFLSLMITGYIYLFYQLMRKGEEHGRFRAMGVTMVFFALHFYLLRSQTYDNAHLFSTYNFTCVFYYLMPMLLNASLVLWIMRQGRLSEIYAQSTPVRKGLLWLWLYLAIFSSIFHNIILIVYLGIYSCWDFLDGGKRDAIQWAKEHKMELVVLLAWLVCLFFEAHGGRARDIGKDTFHLPWMETAIAAAILWSTMKHAAVAICMMVMLLAAGDLFYHRKNEEGEGLRFLATSLMSGILVWVYLFLICTKSASAYFARPDVAVSWCFYLLLLTGFALNHLARRHPVLIQFFPVAIFFAFVVAFNHPRESFRESNADNLPAQTCYDMGHRFIQQMVAADQRGERKVDLHVVKADTTDNWPHATMLQNVLPESLFEHGIIHHRIEVERIPDPEVNREYQLPSPVQPLSKDPGRKD